MFYVSRYYTYKNTTLLNIMILIFGLFPNDMKACIGIDNCKSLLKHRHDQSVHTVLYVMF